MTRAKHPDADKVTPATGGRSRASGQSDFDNTSAPGEERTDESSGDAEGLTSPIGNGQDHGSAALERPPLGARPQDEVRGAAGPEDRVEPRSTAAEEASAKGRQPEFAFPHPFTRISMGPRVEVVRPEQGFDSEQLVDTFEMFVRLVTSHDVRAEKEGPYIARPMPEGDGSRKDANAGAWRVIPLDADRLLPGQERIPGEWLRQSGLMGIVASTYSHRASAPRLRVWLIGDREITAEEHPFLHAALVKQLKEQGIELDPSMAKPSQPVYLPAHPPREPGDDDWAAPFVEVVREGNPLQIDKLLAGYAEAMREERERKAARAQGRSGGGGVRQPGGLIERLNARFDLASFLVEQGYKRKSPDRFVAPRSQSGRDAVQIHEDGCSLTSFHDPAHDPLAALDKYGRRLSRDSFDVFGVLMCGGDFERTWQSAHALGVERGWWSADELPAARGRLAIARPRIHDDALIGLVGEFARAATKQSELSAELVAVTLLARFAATIGRRCYVEIPPQRLTLALSALGVGPSSTGRKGSSDAYPRQLIQQALPIIENPPRELRSLSTGEGLIEVLKDDHVIRTRNKKGQVEEQTVEGTRDKRLMILIEEFVGLLRKAQRKDGTLAETLRVALDGEDLFSPTKVNPTKASRPHVCLVAHGVEEEVMQALPDSLIHGGTINRMLLVASERDRLVSSPEPIPEAEMARIARELGEAVQFAWGGGHFNHAAERSQVVRLSDEAKALWDGEDGMYAKLARQGDAPAGPGGSLVGAMVARAPRLVRVVSALYALLDRSYVVEVPHLKAGFAWAQLSLQVARYMFQKRAIDRRRRTVEGNAMTIRNALQASEEQALMVRDLYRLFNNNASKEEIDDALRHLGDQIVVEPRKTGAKEAEFIVLKQGADRG